MDKLQSALAIVIADSMEPDDINRIVEEGLAAFSEEFEKWEVDDEAIEKTLAIFADARARNGSRGWVDNLAKYSQADDRPPHVVFDENGNVKGARY